jgi:signal transduction histidine kinase/CheY-like chemotaxis protein
LLRKYSFASPALVAASVLMPLMLFGVVAWLDRNAVLAKAQQEVVDTTDVFEAHALNVFETHELVARLVDQKVAGMSWDEIASSLSLHDYMKDIAEQYPQIAGIGLIDATGTLRNSNVTFPTPPVNYADRDYFAALRDKDVGSFVGQPVAGRIRPASTFMLVRRRSSGDGFNGVIVVGLSPDYFVDFWRKTSPSPAMMAGLLRGDLTILAREPASASATLSRSWTTGSAIRERDAGYYRGVSAVDGVDRLMAYRRVGTYDIYVSYGISVSSALASWYQHMVIYGGFFALAAAALSWLSHRVLAEVRRRRLAEERLHQAEKMDALGQLTGQFAHDFGNILTGILLNLEPLRGEFKDHAQLDEAVEHAISAAEQGRKVVGAMLAFARREPLESEELELAETIAGIEVMVRQALGSASDLVVAIPPDAWRVRTDRVQLELAILNLAVNARDAMPDGGVLQIAASNIRAKGDPNGLEGEFVLLSVSDTGAGISKRVIARVFEPFFTTKEEGKGTGLGLSQVYGFATACGGTATVESQVGHGTTVAIYLPRAPEAAILAKEAAEPVNQDSVRSDQKHTILVVEDEQVIRQVVARVLRESDYTVIEAGSGDEALSILPSHPEIALIFTDIRMPGRRDGIAVAAEAKRLRRDIKIVFATGYADALRNFESTTILRKPYRAHQVLEAVEDELADETV